MSNSSHPLYSTAVPWGEKPGKSLFVPLTRPKRCLFRCGVPRQRRHRPGFVGRVDAARRALASPQSLTDCTAPARFIRRDQNDPLAPRGFPLPMLSVRGWSSLPRARRSPGGGWAPSAASLGRILPARARGEPGSACPEPKR